MGYEENPKGQEEQSAGEEKDEFSFMQETIKDETGGRKKTRNQILKYAGFGLVFGLAASLGFCALKPWAERKFQNNPQKVTIPAEEEEDETDQKEEKEEQANPAMTIDDYREMSDALTAVADDVNKSVVKIAETSSAKDWNQETFNSEKSVAGVIVGDNGPQFLIFAKSSILKDSQNMTAEFADGKSFPAELKGRDENIGFAVFAVLKADMPESTKNQVKVAQLGSSNSMDEGDPVIAIGNPFGYAWSMGVGVTASSRNVVEKDDGDYKLICTDIAAAEDGTGVLANTLGEIVGFIDQKVTGEDGANLVAGYGITDLKDSIRLLSNDKAVPYIGIRGVTVTESISQEQEIPQGIYVKEVRADSPAMDAGIQSGDVITSIDKDDVTVLASYHSLLMKKQKGESIKIKGQRQGAGGFVDIEFTVTVGSME